MSTRLHSLAAGIALYAGLACDDPEQTSDLDTQGPPVVTAVMVPSSAAGGGATFTYCSGRDDIKVPYGCPTDGSEVPAVADVPPSSWQIRVIFDELLDPSIEVLDEARNGSIAAADPFTLACDGVELAYDGVYDPSGNFLTSPPGPALVINPTGAPPAPSGTGCTVTVASTVKDKQGESVDEPDPFGFALAPFSVAGSEPPDGATGVPVDAVVIIRFNNSYDLGSVETHVTVETGGVVVPVAITASADDPVAVEVVPEAGTWAAGSIFTVTIAEGTEDVLGAMTPTAASFTFTTE